MSCSFVYILICRDNSYYVGVTDDLGRRLNEHAAGIGSVWTASRLPVAMVFSYEFSDPISAIQAEKQLKGWSRKKKEALIAGRFDLLHELARCRNESSHMSFRRASGL